METEEKTLKERAQRFIDIFGSHAMSVIKKSRESGDIANYELFDMVEELLATK